MKRFTLTQRLSAVFALLLLACCGASAWLQIAANSRYEQEVVQRLSSGLAQHIAALPRHTPRKAGIVGQQSYRRKRCHRFA